MTLAPSVIAQFDLVWPLAELHLGALDEGDFLWRPSEVTWSVRLDDHGVWRPDWADVEPDPMPVPTIAWLTWQVDWWWSTAVDDLLGRTLRRREHVVWPGTGLAAVSRLQVLAREWRQLMGGLTDEDLRRPTSFPWSADAGRIAIDTVLWVNVELTKNIAEIGQLRLLRAAIRS